MKNIEKAWIQWNNSRWINQKIMKGVERPESQLKPPSQFMTRPYEDITVFSLRKISVTPILVEQSLASLVENTVVIDPLDCSSIFQDLANFFRGSQNQLATPSDCHSCKYFSGDQFLKCAVNPARTIDQDCNEFERNFKHPANYSEFSQKEENDA